MGQKEKIVSLLQEKGTMTQGQIAFNYKAYNDYISSKLDEYHITVEHRKRKFDHFVWYKNR